jgi:hypothetical protein
MANNLRNIQLLRSNTVYTDLTAAKAAITAQVSGEASTLVDGSPIVGRYYYGSGGTKSVKSVLGVVHKNLSGSTDVTFFESANDVADAIQKLQAEMDATQAAVGTDADGKHVASSSHFTSAATTVEAEIAALAAALEALNYSKEVGDSEVFSKVIETEGKLSAETKNLTSVKLGGLSTTADTKITSGNTLGEALAYLQGQINSMDKVASAVDGKVVTTVTEADGKVTEVKANVKDLQLGGYEKGAQTGAIASTDTINTALSKIENTIGANKIGNADGSIKVTTASTGTDINVNIKAGEHVLAKAGNAGLYTDIKISSVTPSSDTIKEEYSLVATDGTVLGKTIKIYKDSALTEIYLGSSADTINTETGKITKETVTNPQSLNYAYQLANGKYSLVKVDVSKFLTESEFASGVTQNGAGVVTGVVDGHSEEVITAYSTSGQNTTAKVLSVGTDGFKVNNIQNAINAAIGKAQTTIDTAVASSDERKPHLTIAETVADNGSKTYKFTTSDIASEDELDAEVTRAKNAEHALDAVLGSTKNVDSETRTWTKTGTHYVGTGVTVKDDIVTLDSKLYEASGKTLTNVTSANNSITPKITTHTDGTKTVDLATDASKISGLTTVADANMGLAKISGVSATDSVRTAVNNLYKSIASEVAARQAAISGRTISGSSAITVTETPNADGFNSTVALTLDARKTGNGQEKTGTDNALTITENGLFLSTVWNCGTF